MDKFAIITVESNAAKLVIASVINGNYFTISDFEKSAVKLECEADADMFLKKSQIDSTIKVLKNFRKLCEMHQVKRIIPVAVFSGDKKPKNIYSFFEEIFNSCGFRFTILSEEERNQNIWTGIINTFDLPKGVMCHISSESVSICLYNRRNIINQVNLNFGPKTLADLYPLDATNKAENVKHITEHVLKALDEVEFLNSVDEDFTFIGSGEYFIDESNLVKKLKKYPLDIVDNFLFDAADLGRVCDQVSAADIDKTKKIKGVSEQRADVFVASMLISLAVAKKLKREQVTVIGRGLVEGILFNQVIESTQEKPVSDVLSNSLISQSQIYSGENFRHDEQIYNLALLLFKQLRVLHKLPRTYTKVLRIAAFMHDCGERVGFANRARNGFNVCLGSDIYGATHRELLLASFVIALHYGKELPLSEFIKYKDIITDEDIAAVKKLGIILSLAEAFDRTRNSVIVDINCDILGDSVIMKTISVADNSYEVEKAAECERVFEKAFNKKIEIL